MIGTFDRKTKSLIEADILDYMYPEWFEEHLSPRDIQFELYQRCQGLVSIALLEKESRKYQKEVDAVASSAP